jgi:hypothetical protein
MTRGSSANARSAPPGLSRILGNKPRFASEETAMMQYTTARAIGQARLAYLHAQAQHDALARAARRTRRPDSAYRTPRFLAALSRRARRRGAAVG